jgi:transcriptional regulator with XRE-family HTH domain
MLKRRLRPKDCNSSYQKATMLPNPKSPEFPDALKRERESKGWTRAQLAREAGMHNVMPRRYEDRSVKDFCVPTTDSYRKLCAALGFLPPERTLAQATIEEITAELARRGIGATLSFPAPQPNGAK